MPDGLCRRRAAVDIQKIVVRAVGMDMRRQYATPGIMTFAVAGAVVVSPNASELIHPLTLAIQQRLTVDELASTFTVFPSLSGSIAEAARRLHSSTD